MKPIVLNPQSYLLMIKISFLLRTKTVGTFWKIYMPLRLFEISSCTMNPKISSKIRPYPTGFGPVTAAPRCSFIFLCAKLPGSQAPGNPVLGRRDFAVPSGWPGIVIVGAHAPNHFSCYPWPPPSPFAASCRFCCSSSMPLSPGTTPIIYA